MNDQLEANKRIVLEWNELAFNQRKPEKAVAKYLGAPIGSTILAQVMVPNLLLRL